MSLINQIFKDKCPLDVATELWEKSFFDAAHQLRVEAIKKVLQPKAGKLIETVAADLAESMHNQFESHLKSGYSAHEFKEKLAKSIVAHFNK